MSRSHYVKYKDFGSGVVVSHTQDRSSWRVQSRTDGQVVLTVRDDLSDPILARYPWPEGTTNVVCADYSHLLGPSERASLPDCGWDLPCIPLMDCDAETAASTLERTANAAGLALQAMACITVDYDDPAATLLAKAALYDTLLDQFLQRCL